MFQNWLASALITRLTIVFEVLTTEAVTGTKIS